ncbi:hypothetical protein HNO89_002049 [Sporosarcina luteola]|nr:hypothetical protein [Sporosarcina luteola]
MGVLTNHTQYTSHFDKYICQNDHDKLQSIRKVYNFAFISG